MITEVRIKLIDPNMKRSTPSDEKLLAFCSITINNAFVIRDLKIINSHKGPFVAMPSRKLADRCPRCHTKNHLRSKYCNECGLRLNPDRSAKDSRGRARLHADIAHPINTETRNVLQKTVLDSFEREIELSKESGYIPVNYDDDLIE